MEPRSAPYDCPVQALFNPHLAPFTIQPHAAPFKPCVALFKWQPVVREKQGRYQNDQPDQPSHMGPRSVPYDCPMQALFDPHLAPFTIQPHVTLFKSHSAPFTIQPHAGAPFRGDDFQMQHHKIPQNVQLNQQRKLQQSRPCEHSQQPSIPVIITQKEQIKALYSDVFEGIGHFPGKPYHINLDQSVTPVQT